MEGMASFDELLGRMVVLKNILDIQAYKPTVAIQQSQVPTLSDLTSLDLTIAFVFVKNDDELTPCFFTSGSVVDWQNVSPYSVERDDLPDKLGKLTVKALLVMNSTLGFRITNANRAKKTPSFSLCVRTMTG